MRDLVQVRLLHGDEKVLIMHIANLVGLCLDLVHDLVLVRLVLGLERGVDCAQFADLALQVLNHLFQLQAILGVIGLTGGKLVLQLMNFLSELVFSPLQLLTKLLLFVLDTLDLLLTVPLDTVVVFLGPVVVGLQNCGSLDRLLEVLGKLFDDEVSFLEGFSVHVDLVSELDDQALHVQHLLVLYLHSLDHPALVVVQSL